MIRAKRSRKAVKLLFVLATAWMIADRNNAQSPPYDHSLRVLFVGNSYTYTDDIPWLTSCLANSAKNGRGLETEMIAPPGINLLKHWLNHEVTARLHEKKWDFVVLQEQSVTSLEHPGSMSAAVRLLQKEIEKAGAKTILFLTWPHRESPQNLAVITKNCYNVANDLGLSVA